MATGVGAGNQQGRGEAQRSAPVVPLPWKAVTCATSVTLIGSATAPTALAAVRLAPASLYRPASWLVAPGSQHPAAPLA
jgi:hypothetical protein